jgi:hypothetical protein
MRAAEMVLALIWPVKRGRPVSLMLTLIKAAADIVAALGTIADVVGASHQQGRAVGISAGERPRYPLG